MKASRRFERGYERLTTQERFRLLIAARARADRTESERLLRTCPRQTYTITDPSFVDLYELATHLAIAVVAELIAIRERIAAIDAATRFGHLLFLCAADDAEHEAYRATGTRQPAVRRAVRRHQGRFRKTLRRARRAFITDGASVAHAFAMICSEELGLEPTQLVAAVADPFVDLFEYFATEAVDDKTVDYMRAELAEPLRRYGGAYPAH